MHLVSEGGIEGDSLLEISRHLSACPQCARRAEEMAGVDAVADAMRDAISVQEHPAMADLTAYVDGELDGTAQEWIDAHLESCARCREDVADLRAEQQSLGTRGLSGGSRLWQWTAAGVLIAGAIGGGALWLQSRSPSPLAGPSVRVEAPHAVPAPPSDPWSALERSVLAAGRIEPPEILSALRPVAQAERGAQAAGVIELRPAGEVIEHDRPALTWTASPGARYVVTILKSDEPVIASRPLRDAQWRPPSALHRGTTYSWQVEIERADGSSTVAPIPPHPEALFRIADAETLAGIEAAGRTHPGDRVLLAILYARAGMTSRALAELNAHLAAHPSDSRAAALADAIRRW